MSHMAGHSVPSLLCANLDRRDGVREAVMLMRNAGERLLPSNIPLDYEAQAAEILKDAWRRGLRHNDIWKDDQNDAFAVELVIDAHGRLRLVDFNAPSTCVEGGLSGACRNFSVACTVRDAPHLDDRARLMPLLHAMRAARVSLESYQAEIGITGARVGLCKYDRPLLHVLESNHSVGSCGTMPTQPSGLLSRSKPHLPVHTLGGEHPGHTMASVSDVRACLELCRACSQCRAISVSSAAGVCIWFDSCGPPVSYAGKHQAQRKHGWYWFDDFATVVQVQEQLNRSYIQSAASIRRQRQL